MTIVDGHVLARCLKVSDTRGRCTLAPHAAGDHAWELPVQNPPPAGAESVPSLEALRQTMETTAAKRAEGEANEPAPPEVDAMEKHEANQAQLAAEAADREKQTIGLDDVGKLEL